MPQSLMAREEKIALVREYLERAKNQEISIAEFAHEKGLNGNTFSDWMYKKGMKAEIEGRRKTTGFVGLGKPKAEAGPCQITVRFHEALIECDPATLEQVLKAVRSVSRTAL